MKLNKEQLKRIIKEELEATGSLLEGWTWGDDDSGSGVSPSQQKRLDKTRREKEGRKSKEDAENHPLANPSSWRHNRDSYFKVAMERINDLAGSEGNQLGAKQPNRNDWRNLIVWKANNGFGIYGGSTKGTEHENWKGEDEYLRLHKEIMGPMPQWGDKKDVINDMEEAFLRALPMRDRPDQSKIQRGKELTRLSDRLTSAVKNIASELSISDLMKEFGIRSTTELKDRYEANGGNFQKMILRGVSEVSDVYPDSWDDFAEMSASDRKKVNKATSRSGIGKIVAALTDPETYLGKSLAKKLKKRGFMDKAGSFVKGKGFNEGKAMKLTKEQLKQIIKEELKLVMQEEDPNYVPLTGSDEENAAKDAANAPHFAGVDAGGEETEGGTLSAQFLAGGDYEPKTPEEEEAQKWHARYAKEQEDPED